MKLLNFLKNESKTFKKAIIIMALLSGISNALLLAIINSAAEQVSDIGLQTRYLLLYLATFVLFIYTQRFTLLNSMLAIEEAIRTVRVRIVNKIRCADLAFVEQSGRGDMHTRLTQDSTLISQSVIQLMSSAQSGLVVVFAFIYLAWISLTSFLFAFLFIFLSALTYLSHAQRTQLNLQFARQQEASFFDSLNHLLDGFKEIKINRQKSDDLIEHIERTSKASERVKIEVGKLEVTDSIFSRLCFYALLPMLVFAIPILHAQQTEDIYKVMATILFIMGPVSLFVGALPTMVRVNLAIDNLRALESEIDQATQNHNDNRTPPWVDFEEIVLDTTRFSYHDEHQAEIFSVGPINLSVKKGEMLFIVGGNGSGKTTLLKLLIGLYYPESGAIYVDSKRVKASNYPAYRELFSVIFADFHLFDRLYGLMNADEQTLEHWIKEMQLEKKTKIQDGRFTNLNLSTGQKKRLAFIAAVMENRPVMIFDELAADQDPSFRHYLYEVVFRGLKTKGKTIVAVTHDDQYFHIADRILKMDSGKLATY